MSEEKDIKLIITINNTEPISLKDLSVGLNSFATLYKDFNQDNKEYQLLVHEVRKGSMVMELIASCFPLIPLANDLIIQFGHNMEELKIYFKKNKTVRNQPPSINKLITGNFNKFINIIKYKGDSVKIEAKNNDTNESVVVNIDYKEARDMIRNISNMKGPDSDKKYKKQKFQWEQTNFSESKTTGSKGSIEKICEKPLPVIFDNNEHKIQMTTSNDEVDWHKKFYIVDVILQIRSGEPTQYKIINNYPKDSFPIKLI